MIPILIAMQVFNERQVISSQTVTSIYFYLMQPNISIHNKYRN